MTELRSGAAGRRRMVVGGLLWLTSAQFFVVQVVAQRAWTGSRPYSLRRSWISDLGATTCGTYAGGGGTIVCSPRHALLNAGFVVLGVQVAAGAVLLSPVLASRSAASSGAGRASRIALVLLVVAGAALAFVAAFPEDTGKPWHATAATLHLAAAGLGTLAAGAALRSARHPRMAAVAFLLGGASLIGTVLTGAGSGAGVGRAAVERLAAWPFTAWTTIAGAIALAAALGVSNSGGLRRPPP